MVPCTRLYRHIDTWQLRPIQGDQLPTLPTPTRTSNMSPTCVLHDILLPSFCSCLIILNRPLRPSSPFLFELRFLPSFPSDSFIFSFLFICYFLLNFSLPYFLPLLLHSFYFFPLPFSTSLLHIFLSPLLVFFVHSLLFFSFSPLFFHIYFGSSIFVSWLSSPVIFRCLFPSSSSPLPSQSSSRSP